MEYLSNMMPFMLIILASVALKYACDTFEQSAGYLGRNMPAGVKGATLNAVGSSMPEMFTVVACLFFFNDPEMVTVGLGVTAGSAIFNGCLIPAICIMLAKDERGNKVAEFALDHKALIRDIFWVLVAELSLIYILGLGHISIISVLVLNAIYVGYAVHLYVDFKKANSQNGTLDVNTGEVYEYEELETGGWLQSLVSYNFNKAFFNDKEYNNFRAWVVLGAVMVVIAVWCHILVEGVVGAADVMGIPAFLSGMILGSAASSIPDLILSMKDAQKGEYEDAVANPLASNTFDTTVSFALPLLVWMLVSDNFDLVLHSTEGLNALRWSIIAVTIAVCASLVLKHKAITKNVAYFLFATYFIWGGWVILDFMF